MDINKAASHLPDPKTSGQKFVPVFQAFCQEFKPTMPELKHLLGTTMAATGYQKISSKLTGDQRCVHPVYDHLDNAPYRQARQDLLGEIKKQFPDKIDISKITACRQRPDEPVEDYLTRLAAAFDQNSGVEHPAVLGGTRGVWEMHLSYHFLNGLSPEVAAAVRTSCVLYIDARLDELRRHAVHAQQQQTHKKKSQN